MDASENLNNLLNDPAIDYVAITFSVKDGERVYHGTTVLTALDIAQNPLEEDKAAFLNMRIARTKTLIEDAIARGKGNPT